MKVNKWTLGLAAVGLVSLPASSQAEEKASSVMTALSSTTISGYVDTSAQWNLGTGNANSPGYIYGGAAKADGFNLNKVKLTLEKPLDEAQWAAGYRVDLLFGPDANTFNTGSLGGTSDFNIQQAYVALRAPVQNGLDFKVGVFNSIIGYESHDSVNDPNYTRSYAVGFEPHTHTGVEASYRFTDHVSASVGVANTVGPAINGRATPKAESYKTYMGAVHLTAPNDWGWLGGATLDAGIVQGNASGQDGSRANYYAGLTMNTPWNALRTGVAFDYVDVSGSGRANAWAVAGYASWQFYEKWSLHARGEYEAHSDGTGVVGTAATSNVPNKGIAATATLQYDLWKNVLSRLEFRWDHQADGRGHVFGANSATVPPNVGGGSRRNAYLLAANVIYKF